MANLVSHASRRHRSSASRYKRSSFIYYGEEHKLTYTIYKKSSFVFGKNDKWFEITPNYEYRPDLVSYDYYGTVDFWWRLLEVNKMKDILEFSSGKNIRLPANTL